MHPKTIHLIFLLILIIGTINLLLPVLSLSSLNLVGNDSWIEYYLAKYLINHGITSWSTLKPPNPYAMKFWHPYGRDFVSSEYPFVPIVIAVTYPIGKILGLSFKEWSSLSPILFGILTIIVSYFLAKELFGSNFQALLYSALISIFPSGLSRSFLGFVEKEGFAIPLFLLSILFFIRAYRKENYIEALLSGMFLGLTSISWGGYIFFYGIYALYLLFLPLVKEYTSEKPTIILIFTAISVEIPLVYWGLNLGSNSMVLLFFILSAMISLSSIYLTRNAYLSLIFIVLSSAVGITLGFNLIPERVAYALHLKSNVSPLVATIQEHQASPRALAEIILLLSMIISGTLISLKKIAHKNSIAHLFIFLAGFPSLILFLEMSYLSQVSFTLMALLAVASTGLLKRKYRGRLSSLIIIMLIVSLPSAEVLTFLSRTQVSTYDDIWYKTAEYIRNSLPEDAVLVTWWDYGYMITALTNRTTVADPSTVNSTQIYLLAKLFMGNISSIGETIEALRLPKNKTFIIVYFSFEKHNTTAIINPEHDVAKSLSMLYILHAKPERVDLQKYNRFFASKVIPRYWFINGDHYPTAPKLNRTSLLYVLITNAVYELGMNPALKIDNKIVFVDKPKLEEITLEHLIVEKESNNEFEAIALYKLL